MNTSSHSDTYYLTPSGLDKIKKERDGLLCARAAKGREDEDEILEINRRVTELQSILQNCELLCVPPRGRRHIVALGATVIIVRQGNIERDYTIVSTLETDIHLRRISDESPVGRALIGRAIGDTVMIPLKGDTPYTIKAVRYDL